MPNQIPLDPVLPKAFDATPNESRSKAQLDAWWDHPFGITLPDGRIEVRCLNGGAWDRSTHFGIAESYEAACALAEAKQAEWVRLRARPVLSLDAGQVMVVRMSQRPDEEPQQLATFPSSEEASAFISANYNEASPS
ncbi:MAG: hypothetical protein WBA29_16965 [Xanthobacteraceae bacterium]